MAGINMKKWQPNFAHQNKPLFTETIYIWEKLTEFNF